MKRSLLFCLFAVLSSISISAQFGECTVDQELWADSLIGVYPLPFDAIEAPTGGIPDSICLNEDYQFIFTAVVGEMITVGALEVPIDELEITGISGLPEGLEYACDFPDCKFPSDTTGCAVVYGKVTNPAFLGDNPITISAKVYTSILPLPLDLDFPNPLIAPGAYSFYVFEEGSPNCSVFSDTDDLNLSVDYFRAWPNPSSGYTQMQINTSKSGEYVLQFSDLFGKVVYTQDLTLSEGENKMGVDLSHLPSGMYTYTISDGLQSKSKKLILN